LEELDDAWSRVATRHLKATALTQREREAATAEGRKHHRIQCQ
jgi:hypothetical protein